MGDNIFAIIIGLCFLVIRQSTNFWASDLLRIGMSPEPDTNYTTTTCIAGLEDPLEDCFTQQQLTSPSFSESFYLLICSFLRTIRVFALVTLSLCLSVPKFPLIGQPNKRENVLVSSV